jgi:hypothetical protein
MRRSCTVNWAQKSLAEQGTKAPAAIQKKLDGLAAEEQRLEAEDDVLRDRASRERHNMTTAQEQIQTLALFDDLVRLYGDRPERIKNLIPKFVNFVVWHPGDDEKGEGRFDLSLFARPFIRDDDDVSAWEEALEELDRHHKKTADQGVAQNGGGSRESNIWGPSVYSVRTADGSRESNIWGG